MIQLSADERALLEVLVTSKCPLGAFEARKALLPSPTTRDGRTRERRAWTRRTIELVEAWLDLWNAGLIAEVVKADGENGSKCVITEAGRAALAATAEEGR